MSCALGCFLSIATLVHTAAAQEPAAARPAPPQGFRFDPVNEKSLGLWEGAHPVLVYNHGAISSPRAPNARSRSTYIHPLYGMDGEVLTDDFPADHVNHRGIYWAWPHIRIGDAQYGLWGLTGIRQEFQRWLGQEAAAGGARLGVENGWFVGEKKVMTETVWLHAHPAEGSSRSIDVELTWTPIGEPITLRGAAGKSYGGLTARFGPRTKTIITTPQGRAAEDLVVTRLPWADFSADFKTPGELSGAAIFVHPGHPDFPPTWMTRDYGMLAVGWPGVEPKIFAPGEPFSCRYRIWIHRGAPEAAEIQKAYELYQTQAASPPLRKDP